MTTESNGSVPSQSDAPSPLKRKSYLWSEDLNDFFTSLDSYQPTIPEAVSAYYAEKSGITLKDERIPKLLSLAADKFLSEIIHEAKQISILRQSSVKNQKRKQEMNDTLEIDDLEPTLAQQRIFLRQKKVKTDEA